MKSRAEQYLKKAVFYENVVAIVATPNALPHYFAKSNQSYLLETNSCIMVN
jgi:hypothetical protein